MVDRVVVQRVAELRELVGELVLQVGQLDDRAGLEQRVEQQHLVGPQPVAALAQVGEPVVGLVLAVLARNLLDQDEAADREVDDRRSHVEQVRLLVDERAQLPGTDAVGRLELDRPLRAAA